MSRFLSFMTLVAVGSVAIGTAALIIALTILNGFEHELRTNVIGFSSHIRVGLFRRQTAPDNGNVLAQLRRVRNVAQAAPFLESEAVAIAHDNIEGVRVKGIDPAADFSTLRKKLVAGNAALRDAAGRPAIVVGRRLAEKLGLGLHDKLVLLSVTDVRDVLNAPKIQCSIEGIYETGMSEYIDDIYVFVNLRSAQRLFAVAGRINGYDVLCANVDEIDSTVSRIQTELGYPFDPRSVFSIFRNLFVWISLQQKLIPIVVGSLIVISAFNIIATLLLFVIEKTQNIGILLTLGSTRRSIRRMFMYQGLLIGAIGAIIGCAIAFALCFAQQQFRFFSLPQDVYYMTTVPILMTPAVFLFVSAAAIMLTFLSSLLPAWLGARLNPITSIRFH